MDNRPLPFSTPSSLQSNDRNEERNAPALPAINNYQDFQSHFAELSSYLAAYLAKAAPRSSSRAAARSKFTRLTIHQFHELSTDVCEELVRRKNNQVPFLPDKKEFHPKRNQARRKLATITTSRFEDLSSDVHCELARRYPALAFIQDTNNKEPSPSDNFQAPVFRATDTPNVSTAIKIHSKEFASHLGACGFAARGVLPDHLQQGTTQYKIALLTSQQFYELSTDIYDELIRRKENQVPFLANHNEYYPKRNRARQKLATLPEPRLQDVINDVQNDISRRYPLAKQDTSNDRSSTEDNYQAADFLACEYPEILGTQECDTETTAAQAESV